MAQTAKSPMQHWNKGVLFGLLAQPATHSNSALHRCGEVTVTFISRSLTVLSTDFYPSAAGRWVTAIQSQ